MAESEQLVSGLCLCSGRREHPFLRAERRETLHQLPERVPIRAATERPGSEPHPSITEISATLFQ